MSDVDSVYSQHLEIPGKSHHVFEALIWSPDTRGPTNGLLSKSSMTLVSIKNPEMIRMFASTLKLCLTSETRFEGSVLMKYSSIDNTVRSL